MLTTANIDTSAVVVDNLEAFLVLARHANSSQDGKACAGYTVAKGFTLLYEVTACRAFNDSTPIPCGPLSYSGAVTPVLMTVSAPRTLFNSSSLSLLRDSAASKTRRPLLQVNTDPM